MSLYNLTKPFLFLLSPEKAHSLAILALKYGFLPEGAAQNSTILSQNLWDLHFPNPVGLAAGFDKNAEVYQAMLGQGFGFVETGTVTPLEQAGNEKPRIFRLTEDQAVINRLGFNNRGLDYYVEQLKKRDILDGIVGANIGANKLSDDPINDYVIGLKSVLGLAGYFTVNISSPNTPGLRALQGREALDELLGKLKDVRENANLDKKPPLILKIAPDLDQGECEDIAEIILKHQMDGLIVSNTTLSRDGLTSSNKNETGGLSGRPLFELSTKILSKMYKLTKGQIPLIGAGGVGSGLQAYEKIRAGASLVQLYSALVYHGPGLVRQINAELEELLKKDGFNNVTDAIGIDHRNS
ncbi:MAG: quinone-dependent dihydroorotate dehydrogenase [Kordiimonadaceae bacterium]|jgi:dihydroorotate dehydrogenase|nr:quinone-dependent dihydroorotate dehydrogenase [Kordiimonadaceae bacterium]MBT6036642.1 quinone-dependent dihydroorotate dehydrogenase [Kordiimonadaceae bacterium]MBT6329550.1 quinone-dependent dihydroorotate dehydrogenase [Kordiimonadaceae bacterium]MBT7582641.1 quinone-dependent dihydroorotate dehydrogenase [Kordiimonadaceae bacterium]